MPREAPTWLQVYSGDEDWMLEEYIRLYQQCAALPVTDHRREVQKLRELYNEAAREMSTAELDTARDDTRRHLVTVLPEAYAPTTALLRAITNEITRRGGGHHGQASLHSLGVEAGSARAGRREGGYRRGLIYEGRGY